MPCCLRWIKCSRRRGDDSERCCQPIPPSCSSSLAERLRAASANDVTAPQPMTSRRHSGPRQPMTARRHSGPRPLSHKLTVKFPESRDSVRSGGSLNCRPRFAPRDGQHQFLSRGFCRITATTSKKKKKNQFNLSHSLWLSRSVSLQSCCR